MPASSSAEGRSRLSRVRAIWRRDGLKPTVISIYARWVQRFESDGAPGREASDRELTRALVTRFAARYARRRALDPRCTRLAAVGSLHAWSRALAILGYPVPPWVPPTPTPPIPPLVAQFVAHQRAHRGLRDISIRKQCDHVGAFQRFLRRRHRRVAGAGLADIDAFIVDRRRRQTVTGVADVCSSLRALFRFLYAVGRTRVDLAASIQAPCVRRGAQLPRALPWPSVIRLLHAVDRTSRVGRRDYALLLLMATYGMGAAEAASIRLEDLDWREGTLRLTRPKTGVSILLPLLPPIARALIAYLRRGRPPSTQSRQLFVQMTGAHHRLTTSSAIRHIVRKHARVAGVPLTGLGSHTLRHSHATRQINEGAAAPVVSDILGHRSGAVLSTYARVAVDRLREVALPVPTWA